MTDHSCGAPHSCGGQHNCATTHDHGASLGSHDAGSHGHHQHPEAGSDAGADMAFLLMHTAVDLGAADAAGSKPLGHGARRSGALPGWALGLLVALIAAGAFVLWINVT